MRKRYLILPLLLSASVAFAGGFNSGEGDKDKVSKETKQNWQHLDLEEDGIPGISANKAYETILKGKTSKKVTVAIIDSGVDIEHEDLKGLIWTNKNEIPDNGKDDDGNGYVDDVHGWNYLGHPNGDNIELENFEITRLYKRYKTDFEGKKPSTAEEKEEYKKFKEYEKAYFDRYKETGKIGESTRKTYAKALEHDAALNEYFKKSDYSKEELEELSTSSAEGRYKKAAKFFLNNRALSYYEWKVNWIKTLYAGYLNVDLNARDVVGDNPEDLKDTVYGNSDVIATGAEHGTHVAGIIGANRSNDLGMKGIADNVEFMVLRCVPDGDERDKDVARAIRYAVDNGAQVMNMSFGKDFASDQKAVEEAIKYAEDKGIILMIAAGNDSRDLEKKDSYPKTIYMDGTRPSNVLYVGASSINFDRELPAIFSNYAQNKVDFFSPGVDIYSTLPDNKYRYMSGTSMATPVAAGAAAVLLSYYPELSGADVVDILKKSVTTHKGKMVRKPNPDRKDKKTVDFAELSQTGGIVNLYEACKLAEQRVKSLSKR
ncbi:S8 family serine peptidase [Aureibacter tunicatorum]|uniref:Subtilisin family serine protease n=1 Tax=Aureibacter tunicatorum TaxID=866807 RepID=A0AAE3XQ76_9BACT|nr:S8 family serine peptidase [Aureibacter tunicatorum]MDR6240029.1 subtilisin family serine protease [Aureibacter tunicatorum]BDD04501.1 peptidase S8 [Aureibacter tunicatorum]